MTPWDGKKGNISNWGWLSIVNEGYNRCGSFVGRTYSTRQEVTTGVGCWTPHLLGLTLGLNAEHRRFDRDKYLMFKKNVNKPKNRKKLPKRFMAPYNFLSVM
jgi:hypothetical protein